MFNPTSPLSGATVTGLTTPTYTLAADTTTDGRTKQFYVSALGGTQTGVVVHSSELPFLINVKKAFKVAVLGAVSALTGIRSIPKTSYVRNTIKGVFVDTLGNKAIAQIKTIMDIPAGAITQDYNSILAMISLDAAVGTNQVQAMADLAKQNTV